MKYIATLIPSLALSCAASAAPLENEGPADASKIMAAEVLDSAAEPGTLNRNALDSYSALNGGTWGECGCEAPVPEPASLMLLGIGLCATALRRRK